jgi:hypothetical protein
VVGAIWLGLGAYSYLGAVVMMPVYLAISLAVGYRRLGLAAAAKAVAAFLATLVPMALWYVTHPERSSQLVTAYRLDAGDSSLSRWVGQYWAFFDPAFLFVSGDSSLVNSTREAGFFAMAFAVLLPIGLWALLRARQTLTVAIAIGFLTAPLVAMVSGALELNRLMFAVPFGALTAAYGAHVFWRAKAAGRLVCVTLLLSIAWQFAGFYSTYFGSYRAASAPWFGGNLRDANAAVIAAQPPGRPSPIYISAHIPYASRYWRFDVIRHHRDDLPAPEYVDAPPPAAAAGAWLICASAAEDCRSAQASGWRKQMSAVEPDGTPTFDVLVREPQ